MKIPNDPETSFLPDIPYERCPRCDKKSVLVVSQDKEFSFRQWFFRLKGRITVTVRYCHKCGFLKVKIDRIEVN